MRASLPFSRVPGGVDGSTSGVGDLDAFFAYLFDTGTPTRSVGVGPQIVLPTASEDETGSGKYQLGAAAVYFDAASKFVQWGGLATWRTDIGGDDDRDEVNLLALQPFYFFSSAVATICAARRSGRSIWRTRPITYLSGSASEESSRRAKRSSTSLSSRSSPCSAMVRDSLTCSCSWR